MSKNVSRRAILGALAAPALGLNPAGAQSSNPAKAASSVSDDVTPLLYAQASGMLPRFGLRLVLEKVSSGNAVVAGVAGGAYDIGKSNMVPLITAHVKGIPFVLVAPGGIYNSSAPVTALLCRSNDPIKDAPDLNGKTIAVSALWDLYSLSIRNWVDSHGGDSTTLKFVEMPAASVPAAIEAGRVDAGALEEPHLSEALRSGNVHAIAHIHDSIAPRFLLTAWFTTLEYAQRNRSILDKFRAMIKEAAAYANGHHAATVALISNFSLVQSDVISRGTRVTWGGTLDPKLVQPVIDLCAKYKVIPRSFNARDMFDPALTG